MTSSSNRSARVIKANDVTVVGRPGAAATDPARLAGSPSAPAWRPDELAGFAFAFGGAARAGEAEPSLSTTPQPGPGTPLELIAAELTAAREEGYALGVAEGRDAYEAELGERIAIAMHAVESAATMIRDEERHWTANAEENLVALAIAVARHVIEREVAIDDAILRTIVSRALAEFPLAQAVTVRLHPDDLALLDRSPSGGIGGGRAELIWSVDPRVVRGGCVVEGRERIIDGRVDTALERLYRRLSGTGA